MLDTEYNAAAKLLNVLQEQNKTITLIYELQKALRTTVNEKNWINLQNNAIKLTKLSENFSELEMKRVSYFSYFGNELGNDVYKISKKIHIDFSKKIIFEYNTLRQKLAVSKIENNSLNDYIRITSNFIQGVFDNVIPQRKNIVYSRNGQLIKNQPKSLVVNAVL